MKLGASTPSSLDTARPQLRVLLGGRVGGSENSGFARQGGDSHFLQRFALGTHGPYNEAAAIRFAFEHQNPPMTGRVVGHGSYPATQFSLLSVSDPGVVLWALKPAEEGIGQGFIVRLWNHSNKPAKTVVRFAEGLTAVKRTTHIETDPEDATIVDGRLLDTVPGNWMQTYRLIPGGR
jgi:alpha-mannosidase